MFAIHKWEAAYVPDGNNLKGLWTMALGWLAATTAIAAGDLIDSSIDQPFYLRSRPATTVTVAPWSARPGRAWSCMCASTECPKPSTERQSNQCADSGEDASTERHPRWLPGPVVLPSAQGRADAGADQRAGEDRVAGRPGT